MREAWPGVAVDHVESLDGDQVEVGTKIHVSALVRLGELTPDDVEVQLITGRMGSDDQLYEPRVIPFPTGIDIDGGLRRYESWVEARRAGAIGYTVRVVPASPAAGQLGRDGPGRPARHPAGAARTTRRPARARRTSAHLRRICARYYLRRSA